MRVGVAQARDLPARHRPEQPALADGRGVLHRPVGLDGPEQRTVELGDGEGPVQVRRLQGLRVVDGLQHGAAGSDEEDADVARAEPLFRHQPPAQQLGGQLPRGLDGQQVVDHVRVAELDQVDDGGAGHRDLGPGTAALREVGVGGAGVHVAHGRQVVDVVEAQAAERLQHLARLHLPAELRVQGQRGQGHRVLEAPEVRGGGGGRVHRPVPAPADALAAVDAEVGVGHRAPAPHADGPGGTGLAAVDAAHAALLVEDDRVLALGTVAFRDVRQVAPHR